MVALENHRPHLWLPVFRPGHGVAGSDHLRHGHKADALMAAKLQVIVDLPTPPFWLKMTLRMLFPMKSIR